MAHQLGHSVYIILYSF